MGTVLEFEVEGCNDESVVSDIAADLEGESFVASVRQDGTRLYVEEAFMSGGGDVPDIVRVIEGYGFAASQA